MSPEEAFGICRLAKGAFPATTMDEFTPESWSLALEDDRFVDAREALKQLLREQTFIHVSDIVKRIKKIRHDRVMAYGPIEPPADLNPDDPRAYSEWYVRKMQAVADGDDVNPMPALPSGRRAPWTEDQDEAVLAARMKTIRAEVAKRKPTPPPAPAAAVARQAHPTGDEDA